MKRVTVFVSGLAAGAAGSAYAGRKVKKTVKNKVKNTVQNTTERLNPANLKPANLNPTGLMVTVGRSVKSNAEHLVEAVREGRSAMHEREAELKLRRDGTPSALDDRLAPDETLYVDGRPVDVSRVVVMKAPEAGRSRGLSRGRHRAHDRGRGRRR